MASSNRQCDDGNKQRLEYDITEMAELKEPLFDGGGVGDLQSTPVVQDLPLSPDADVSIGGDGRASTCSNNQVMNSTSSNSCNDYATVDISKMEEASNGADDTQNTLPIVRKWKDEHREQINTCKLWIYLPSVLLF